MHQQIKPNPPSSSLQPTHPSNFTRRSMRPLTMENTSGDTYIPNKANPDPPLHSIPSRSLPTGLPPAKQRPHNISITHTPLSLAQSNPSSNQETSITQALHSLLGETTFFIPASKVSEITSKLNISQQELLVALIPLAQTHARPPISNYQVGAVGLGASSNIYLGANLEFPGHPLNRSVHAEQFVIANALRHGETELKALAVSAEPCGHCRQFLNELNHKESLKILIPNKPPISLEQLLPRSFGPQDLGVRSALLGQSRNQVALRHALLSSPLILAALEAAKRSYSPYTHSPSGVAIQAGEKIYTGSYIENAAFNPSLSPLQAALIDLVADGQSYNHISEVVLVEKPTTALPSVSQANDTRSLLETIAPEANFQIYHLSKWE